MQKLQLLSPNEHYLLSSRDSMDNLEVSEFDTAWLLAKMYSAFVIQLYGEKEIEELNYRKVFEILED